MKNALLSGLKLPDYASLIALVLSWMAIVLLLKSLLFASLGIAVIALIADMMDGFLARKYGGSSIGKYIDSFLDVILYLIYPALYLFVLGFSDTVSVTMLAVFIVAGVLRLARFTAEGFEKDKDQRYYKGMPVFWNLLWLYVVVILAKHGLLFDTRWLILNVGLLVVSWLMISSIKFPKPANYTILLPLLTIVAVSSVIAEFFI